MGDQAIIRRVLLQVDVEMKMKVQFGRSGRERRAMKTKDAAIDWEWA